MSEINETEPIQPTSDQPTSVPDAIDPAFLEKLLTLKSIVNLDNILTNCLFPGGVADEILRAKQFLQRLHAPLHKECESHPDFARATKPQSATPQSSPEDLAAQTKAIEKRNRKARRQRTN